MRRMISDRHRYRSFGQFIKAKREQGFRSARDFCSKVAVGISYPQYSRYEAGDQLPGLEQALALGKLLGVPTVELLLEWSQAQVQEASARQEVDALLKQVRAQSEVPAASRRAGALR